MDASDIRKIDVDASLPIDEIQADGAWGFVRGIYEMRLEPKGEGDPVSSFRGAPSRVG